MIKNGRAEDNVQHKVKQIYCRDGIAHDRNVLLLFLSKRFLRHASFKTYNKQYNTQMAVNILKHTGHLECELQIHNKLQLATACNLLKIMIDSYLPKL